MQTAKYVTWHRDHRSTRNIGQNQHEELNANGRLPHTPSEMKSAISNPHSNCTDNGVVISTAEYIIFTAMKTDTEKTLQTSNKTTTTMTKIKTASSTRLKQKSKLK